MTAQVAAASVLRKQHTVRLHLSRSVYVKLVMELMMTNNWRTEV